MAVDLKPFNEKGELFLTLNHTLDSHPDISSIDDLEREYPDKTHIWLTKNDSGFIDCFIFPAGQDISNLGEIMPLLDELGVISMINVHIYKVDDEQDVAYLEGFGYAAFRAVLESAEDPTVYMPYACIKNKNGNWLQSANDIPVWDTHMVCYGYDGKEIYSSVVQASHITDAILNPCIDIFERGHGYAAPEGETYVHVGPAMYDNGIKKLICRNLTKEILEKSGISSGYLSGVPKYVEADPDGLVKIPDDLMGYLGKGIDYRGEIYYVYGFGKDFSGVYLLDSEGKRVFLERDQFSEWLDAHGNVEDIDPAAYGDEPSKYPEVEQSFMSSRDEVVEIYRGIQIKADCVAPPNERSVWDVLRRVKWDAAGVFWTDDYDIAMEASHQPYLGYKNLGNMYGEGSREYAVILAGLVSRRDILIDWHDVAEIKEIHEKIFDNISRGGYGDYYKDTSDGKAYSLEQLESLYGHKYYSEVFPSVLENVLDHYTNTLRESHQVARKILDTLSPDMHELSGFLYHPNETEGNRVLHALEDYLFSRGLTSYRVEDTIDWVRHMLGESIREALKYDIESGNYPNLKKLYLSPEDQERLNSILERTIFNDLEEVIRSAQWSYLFEHEMTLREGAEILITRIDIFHEGEQVFSKDIRRTIKARLRHTLRS